MESPDPTRMRLKLLLGKFLVKKIIKGVGGFEFVLELPNSIYMTVAVPTRADVREGDLLTIYTEVYTHAHTEPTSVQ